MDAYKTITPQDIRKGCRLTLVEYAYHLYFKYDYKYYGFTTIKHEPTNLGVDFMALSANLWVKLELETKWKHYLLHKHNKDTRFNDTLILYLPNTPSNHAIPYKSRKLLPPIIKYWDTQRFSDYIHHVANFDAYYLRYINHDNISKPKPV